MNYFSLSLITINPLGVGSVFPPLMGHLALVAMGLIFLLFVAIFLFN